MVEQVRLTASGLHRRIMSRKLTFLDVREDIANLVTLFEITRKDNRQAAQVCQEIR